MGEECESTSEGQNYRCGLYFASHELADVSGSLKDVEHRARSLSKDNDEALVAVWDGHGQPLKLYIGNKELKFVR